MRFWKHKRRVIFCRRSSTQTYLTRLLRVKSILKWTRLTSGEMHFQLSQKRFLARECNHRQQVLNRQSFCRATILNSEGAKKRDSSNLDFPSNRWCNLRSLSTNSRKLLHNSTPNNQRHNLLHLSSIHKLKLSGRWQQQSTKARRNQLTRPSTPTRTSKRSSTFSRRARKRRTKTTISLDILQRSKAVTQQRHQLRVVKTSELIIIGSKSQHRQQREVSFNKRRQRHKELLRQQRRRDHKPQQQKRQRQQENQLRPKRRAFKRSISNSKHCLIRSNKTTNLLVHRHSRHVNQWHKRSVNQVSAKMRFHQHLRHDNRFSIKTQFRQHSRLASQSSARMQFNHQPETCFRH